MKNLIVILKQILINQQVIMTELSNNSNKEEKILYKDIIEFLARLEFEI